MRKLDIDPLRQIVGAHRQQAGRSRSGTELFAFVELLLWPEATYESADTAMRKSAVGRAEAARLVACRGQQARRLEDMIAHITFVALAADRLDQRAGYG